jgi:hypothetical protein
MRKKRFVVQELLDSIESRKLFKAKTKFRFGAVRKSHKKCPKRAFFASRIFFISLFALASSGRLFFALESSWSCAPCDLRVVGFAHISRIDQQVIHPFYFHY